MTSLRRRVLDAGNLRQAPERPPPSHRHNGPSAPWPWINIHDEVDPVQLASPLPPVPPPCDHKTCDGCWKGYPQSRFPNWTPSQVRRSGIHRAITQYNTAIPSTIHYVDVDSNGFFTDSGKFVSKDDSKDELWNTLINEDSQRPDNIRVRALFIENMSGPVLQMLGAKYNVEPFFFSSSLGWIPSRYQEEIRPKQGDHITITLTFLRPMDHPEASSMHTFPRSDSASDTMMSPANLYNHQVINTQAPLFLSHGDHYLILDLLAVHLIRSTDGNTIISYHNTEPDTTSAPYLHERIRFAGQSVYWQSIFQKSPDPTFVLLTFIWHAMYAWDEALELLYAHIAFLETRVINTSNLLLTRELHIIRAHHLHYSALLEDFRKTVVFVQDTPNPAMDALSDEERLYSRRLLERECNTLLNEIDRLEMGRKMQEKRLKNVMNLVFSSVNIGDSKRMQQLTEAAVRDSAASAQIAYLSMIFLPASFVAGIFGMNISEFSPDTHGSWWKYVATALPLTVVTVWIVMSFQIKYLMGHDVTIWMRLFWPVTLARSMNRRERDPDYALDAPVDQLGWRDEKE
ncbi:hypothetical protein DFH07DRAFT_830716 [Mycena maculata]|uniref:Uncharacterized protein n=1 Tax=Mycena maculata TaxID=230809 RepID=A0AAD7N6N3_9AGAR|nr:hypothetical protein DFH07DRAFT_830716 [Mycena maculata]